MNKNKKKIIIGMLIFMLIFLPIVFYYETTNIEVESDIYYVSDKIQKNLEIDGYKILDIVKSEEEYDKFIKTYDLYSNDYKGNQNNYLYVAVNYDTCSEYVRFDRIKKNKDKYELVFINEISCDGDCTLDMKIFEIPIDKFITDKDKYTVTIDHQYTDDCDYDELDMTVKKPVLYLYPEEDMMVNVTFDNKDKLLSTYPKYKNEWNVFAKKDGTLIDENGRKYYALYWDENIKHEEKFKTGFYVKSKDSIKFLEEKLFEMGFTDREANEFIMYWLPIMEQGGDNLVHFHFTEDRQKQNKINIEPEVDSLFRVSIEIKKVKKKVSIKEQKIERFERYGFSALEWGGSIIK